MTKPTLTIPINHDLGNQAQAVLDNYGLDINSAVNLYLAHIAQNNATPFELNKAKGTIKKWTYGNNIFEPEELVPSSLVKAAGIDNWDEEGFAYYYIEEEEQ